MDVIYFMNEYDKINYFNELLNKYICNINELVEYVVSLKLLSSYMTLFIPQIKNYIENNKVDVLQKCVINIDDFQKFSFDDFSEMDDNESYNTYMPKIKNTDINSHNSNELFKLLLEIKNNSANLDRKYKYNIQKKINKIQKIIFKVNELFTNN